MVGDDMKKKSRWETPRKKGKIGVKKERWSSGGHFDQMIEERKAKRMVIVSSDEETSEPEFENHTVSSEEEMDKWVQDRRRP
jgi:hypothetical protein